DDSKNFGSAKTQGSNSMGAKRFVGRPVLAQDRSLPSPLHLSPAFAASAHHNLGPKRTLEVLRQINQSSLTMLTDSQKQDAASAIARWWLDWPRPISNESISALQSELAKAGLVIVPKIAELRRVSSLPPCDHDECGLTKCDKTP